MSEYINIRYKNDENDSSLIGLDADDKTMCIPKDTGNRHYQEYLKWVEDGNTPEPADE